MLPKDCFPRSCGPYLMMSVWPFLAARCRHVDRFSPRSMGLSTSSGEHRLLRNNRSTTCNTDLSVLKNVLSKKCTLKFSNSFEICVYTKMYLVNSELKLHSKKIIWDKVQNMANDTLTCQFIKSCTFK